MKEHLSSKMVLILGGILFLGVLVGLFVGSVNTPPTASKGSDPGESDRKGQLPWEPLRHPEAELLMVSDIVDNQETTPEAKLGALVRLSQIAETPQLTRGLASFATGVILRQLERPEEAAEWFLKSAVTATELAAYGLHFVGEDLEDSRGREALRRLCDDYPEFISIDEARLRYGRLLVGQGAKSEGAGQFRRILADGRLDSRGEALYVLAEVLSDPGERREAARFLEELYYDLPTDELSDKAGRMLASLRKYQPERSQEESFRLAWNRAEKLLESGRAREAYAQYSQLLKHFPTQADEQRIRLRLGVCQYRSRQNSAAERTLSRVNKEELKPEALFYQAEAARRLRKLRTHRERLHQVLELAPRSRWAEESLWSLARSHMAEDEATEALAYYERLASEFPESEYYVEARWRVLWAQYKMGRYLQAAEGFLQTAREHPESDELPQLLYWAGRAYQGHGRPDRALQHYRQVLLGHAHTYYGRRAAEQVAAIRGESLVPVHEGRGIDLTEAFRVSGTDRQRRIGQLLAVGLPREAEKEAEESAGRDGDDDPAFLAILAWLYYGQGRYREAMATMRRAFPFHVSAAGDLLPAEIWEILYPLKYWDLIERYSKEHDVDPYLVVSIIRQESTFDPEVRSQAGARGLMQIMPFTGRKLARDHRRRYQTLDLHDPEIGILYGTYYLREVLDRFEGRWDYALASYNAGPHRVRAWTAMDLSLDSEEFIEEIPFTETRNYVKLVLRNEMMYRRIYDGSRPFADRAGGP